MHEIKENMIDINVKGVLYGIAAALPVFRKQGFGHFVNTASTAGISVHPNMAVYAGTKFAVREISEGLRQEAGDKFRVTIITPGFVTWARLLSVPRRRVSPRYEPHGLALRAVKAADYVFRSGFSAPPHAIS
jgi:NADP-dependent 3-hydroxy acid dehydrogenase YdfG